ncbi:ATP-grasp fold amidoligase family protein [Promicromonospora sp. NPDC023987]|uniref:ATP-grasp fold amidoligase family protein n=1 Tax=Promicromonospora sp. NPDC023987 TaxID=3155360 RepID=UPI0033EB9536
MRFIEHLQLRGSGKERRVPWFLHDKIKCYEFAKLIGVPVVEILRTFDDPGQIDLNELPDRFVLKPTYESSSIGVMVLARTGDGYHESMRSVDLSFDDIVARHQELYDRSTKPNRMTIVEERIVDESGRAVPMDYKAYAFQGEIAFVIGFDRNGKKTRLSWFDENFDPMDLSRVTTNLRYLELEESPSRPQAWRDLLEVARRASVAAPTPFVRVDMYATAEGAVLGEMTLVPGGFYFGKHYQPSADEDFVLGRMWERAERRLSRAKG